MKVNKIKIENYRGFKDCSIDFHPKINVFIGSNASGKTTILNAIVKSLYSFTSNFVTNTFREDNLILDNQDINHDHIYTTIISNLSIDSESIQTFIGKGFFYEGLENIREQIQNKQYNLIEELEYQINSSSLTIPIIKFYPANRGNFNYTFNNHPDYYRISQLEVWDNIYESAVSYSKFFNWFYENETNELRLQRDHKSFNFESPVLKGVRRALHEAFKLLGYGEFRLVSKQIPNSGNSKLYPTLVLKNLITDKEEYIDRKSDGEKAITVLVANIAYNLSIAKNFVDDDDFLQSPGVVMIDEIETHLHPKWQREIIPILTTIFPNIQFFIATHSPQVVSSVSSESVFVCDNFNVEGVHLKTYGEDTNSLLKYIFESTERPKEYINLLKYFDNLIDNNGSEKQIRNVINQIENLYNRDKAPGISNLIDELNIKLSAYNFEKEYEKNN